MDFLQDGFSGKKTGVRFPAYKPIAPLSTPKPFRCVLVNWRMCGVCGTSHDNSAIKGEYRDNWNGNVSMDATVELFCGHDRGS